MSADVLLSPQIISAGGVALSALVSFLVAKSQTKTEIKKMMLSWVREDIVSSDEDFAAMANSVGDYIAAGRLGLFDDCREAAAKVSAMRAKESGPLGAALDELYLALQNGGYDDVDASLTKVIDTKRQKRRQSG